MVILYPSYDINKIKGSVNSGSPFRGLFAMVFCSFFPAMNVFHVHLLCFFCRNWCVSVSTNSYYFFTCHYIILSANSFESPTSTIEFLTVHLNIFQKFPFILVTENKISYFYLVMNFSLCSGWHRNWLKRKWHLKIVKKLYTKKKKI